MNILIRQTYFFAILFRKMKNKIYHYFKKSNLKVLCRQGIEINFVLFNFINFSFILVLQNNFVHSTL